MKKFLGFDLEIAKEIPEGEDWKQHRPLGITCASAVADDLVKHWEADLDTPYMTFIQCWEMITDLVQLTNQGYSIVTWNGLQFDFNVLQEESRTNLYELALEHFDPMFQFFCMTGYPVGLDTVAKTMGLQGKLEGMTGALAPSMWKVNPKLVIEYVIQDGKTTLEVANAIEEKKMVAWMTRSNKYKIQSFPSGLMNVEECLKFPLPDQSWMTNPISRESFIEWMEK